METPLLSAIVPVCNGAATLGRAVESIRQQEYRPIEIVVVDDGSTDATPEVAAGLGDGIRYIRQENGGPEPGPSRGAGGVDRVPGCRRSVARW